MTAANRHWLARDYLVIMLREAWSSLYRTRSRLFDPPETGTIAVKVINHHGDEVLKTYRVASRLAEVRATLLRESSVIPPIGGPWRTGAGRSSVRRSLWARGQGREPYLEHAD
jgi:hypothetical protein